MTVNFDLATQQRLRVGDTEQGGSIWVSPASRAELPGWARAWLGFSCSHPCSVEAASARPGVSGGAFPVSSPPGPSV